MLITIVVMANNWGLVYNFFFVCASFFVTYSLNCIYTDSQLPTERTIVCEDAIHNSYAFVQLILVFTISFFTLFLFVKIGLTFIFLKIFSNLDFLHNTLNSFSNTLSIRCLKGNKDPGKMKFNCSEESSAWKRD